MSKTTKKFDKSKKGSAMCAKMWGQNVFRDGRYIHVACVGRCPYGDHCNFAHEDLSKVLQCVNGGRCSDPFCPFLHENDSFIEPGVQDPRIQYFKKNWEISEDIFNEDGEVITTLNYDRSFPKKVAVVKVPEVALQSTKKWGDIAETAAEEADALAKFKKVKEEAQKALTALQNSLKAMEVRSSKIDSQIEDLKKEKVALDKKMQEIREQLKN